MEIRKTLRQMAGRPQLGAFFVTDFAAIGSFDPGMADQAIGHLRQVGGSNLVGFRHAAMAGAAGIPGIAVQVPADVASRLKVSPVVDCRCQDPRHVAHFQMQGVVEMSHPGGRWTRYGNLLMALTAYFFGGK